MTSSRKPAHFGSAAVTDEVAVADAHVDYQLLRAVRRPKQIVARRKLKQLAHVSGVLNERYLSQRRNAVARKHVGEVFGTQAD